MKQADSHRGIQLQFDLTFEWAKRVTFEHVINVGAWYASSSNSETAIILRFSCITFLTFTENGAKNIQSAAVLWEKNGGERQELCKLTDGPLKQYNSVVQNVISERTTHRSLSPMGYRSRQPHHTWFHSYQL